MNARTPFAYIAVGGSCLVLHNIILIGANRVGVALWAAVLMSFVTVTSVGYVLHATFTFRQPLAIIRWVRYAMAMSANIPLAYVTTWVWYAAIGLPMTLAAPIASCCMLALNFVLGRWAIAAPDPKMIEGP
jgi:putative flippase GtrA